MSAQRTTSAVTSPRIMISAGVLSLVLVGFMVFQVTTAAFTDTTSNPDNSWTAGEVSISDDAEGVALFDESGLVPGYSQTEEIVVSNTSTIPTEAAFYVAGMGGDLADFLTIDVTADGAEVFSGTFAELADLDSFETGSQAGAPGSGDSSTYTITVAFPDGDDVDDAQGTSATVDFVWEARST